MNYERSVSLRAGKVIPVEAGSEAEQKNFYGIASCVCGGFLIGDSTPDFYVPNAHEISAAAVAHAIMTARHLHSDLPRLVADELKRLMDMPPEKPSMPPDISQILDALRSGKGGGIPQ